MRVILACIGRLKDGGERDLIERYTGRFDASGRAVALGPLSIVELTESRKTDANGRKSDEASRLLAAAASASLRIVLDEHGHSETSEAFARRLGGWRDAGIPTLAVLIGGPDGHGEEAIAAADLRLALGAMTLPHGLARVIIVEQLYRAVTILSGHPYHRS